MKGKKLAPIPPTRRSRARAELKEAPESDSLLDDDEWEIFLEPLAARDASAVDEFARLLSTLEKALDRPQGREQLRATLRAGIRKAALYSRVFQESIDLYQRYIAGTLKPEEEPKK